MADDNRGRWGLSSKDRERRAKVKAAKNAAKRWATTGAPRQTRIGKDGKSYTSDTSGGNVRGRYSSAQPTQSRYRTTTTRDGDTTTKVTKRVQTNTAGDTKAEAKVRSKYSDRDYRRRRELRASTKQYKGKYLGPDVFKGSEAKIKAWKLAGKPRNADGTAKEV